jgi:hypothetical protein
MRTDSTRMTLLRQDGMNSEKTVVVVFIDYYYYKRNYPSCEPLAYTLGERRYELYSDSIGDMVLAHANRSLWHLPEFERRPKPRFNRWRFLANLSLSSHMMRSRPMVSTVYPIFSPQ